MITYTYNADSSNVFLARMTLSDIFGGLSILLFFLWKWNKGFDLRRIPKEYYIAFGMLIFISSSIITSLSKKETIKEMFILLYLVIYSYVLFDVYKKRIAELFRIIAFTCFCFSAIAIYDLIAVNLNWYTVFPNPSKVQGGSSFRYFGQAANYAFTMLCVLIPYYVSEIAKKGSDGDKRIYIGAIVATLLLMFSTGRISVLISFFISVLFYVVLFFRDHKKEIFTFFGVVVLFLVLIFIFFPDVIENTILRFQLRISNRIEGDLGSEFFVDNIKGALQAFMDNPILGSGLGAFVGVYSIYEIHGTYFKIVGETGLVGLLGYLVFLGMFLKLCLKKKTLFFNYFFPFLFGSIMCWGYNYHLRKKEFWLFFTVVLILNYLKKNEKEPKI